MKLQAHQNGPPGHQNHTLEFKMLVPMPPKNKQVLLLCFLMPFLPVIGRILTEGWWQWV